MKQFQNGDVVRLQKSEQWDNEIGIVYDTYQDFDDASRWGVSILTEAGHDLGGFSFDEQQRYLELVNRNGFEYPFKSVIQLGRDYLDGVFQEVFKAAHEVMERE